MSKFFPSLGSFREFLDEQAVTYPERMVATAGAAAMILKTSIQKQFGDKAKLAPLTDTTISLRSDGGDTPLYITGELLRDSIESEHEAWGEGAVAGAGSSEPIVVYHEHGYTTSPRSMIPNKPVPPRPAFAIGVYEALPVVKEVVEELLAPGFSIRNVRGRFSSFSNPDAMLSNVGDPE